MRNAKTSDPFAAKLVEYECPENLTTKKHDVDELQRFDATLSRTPGIFEPDHEIKSRIRRNLRRSSRPVSHEQS